MYCSLWQPQLQNQQQLQQQQQQQRRRGEDARNGAQQWEHLSDQWRERFNMFSQELYKNLGQKLWVEFKWDIEFDALLERLEKTQQFPEAWVLEMLDSGDQQMLQALKREYLDFYRNREFQKRLLQEYNQKDNQDEEKNEDGEPPIPSIIRYE